MAQKKKFKITLDAIISWGATVVIIGAMFKILHLPGGAIIIGIGLGTEALLFFIMHLYLLIKTQNGRKFILSYQKIM
jgi:hypothetical protein